MKNTRIASVVAALLAVSAFTNAQAADFSIGNYTALFQGVDETTATIQGGSGTSQAYVVRIDLAAPGVSFTTTAGAPGTTPNAGRRSRGRDPDHESVPEGDRRADCDQHKLLLVPLCHQYIKFRNISLAWRFPTASWCPPINRAIRPCC